MKTKILVSIVFYLFFHFSNSQNFNYVSVPGDKTETRIYTLDNGLKVYISPNRVEPRILAYVAVRAGGKNDPAESTGLAHYFEHMMFKGTQKFGTKDWEKEKVLIDEIENLFEVYRKTTNEAERSKIYKRIDSLSYLASKYAIPNEYDKLMSIIGSNGTNAFTGYDQTVYTENIPSNQLENWAYIQADRIANPVLRLFHTELETVYEEKNMYSAKDWMRVSEAMLSSLYPHHPYGTQTVIGKAEHLKNPSMKNIREFHAKYYVPNNMAVCLVGDVDPDEAIKIINKYFGALPRKEDPKLEVKPSQPITTPIIKEVTGNEAESVLIAYRMEEGVASDKALIIQLIHSILNNGKAGLIDVNLTQKQKVLSAYASPWMKDNYTTFILGGTPKEGQTLEEVKDLLLEQIELLKNGNFPDWLIEAAINNAKLNEMYNIESNSGRMGNILSSFLYNVPWERTVRYIELLGKINKQQIIDFARSNFKNNYVIVYKRQGKPEDYPTIQKPPITPVHINRDDESEFVKEMKQRKVNKIEPVFLDFNKDFQRYKTKDGIEILYIENKTNKTFSLTFRYEFGSYYNKDYKIIDNIAPYIATSKRSVEEIKQEFYKLACSYSISCGDEVSSISLSGLSENFDKALTLLEEILNDPKISQDVLDNVVKDILKARKDAKLNQNANFSALVDYAMYGKNSPGKYFLTEEELYKLTPAKIEELIKSFSQIEHKILFYGDIKPNDLISKINKIHKVVKPYKSFPNKVTFEELPTTKNQIYFVDYDAKQAMCQIINKGVKFDKELYPVVALYNSYFSGSMNAIVFQEIREKRSLAYSAYSSYRMPSKKEKSFMNIAFVGTQNDKIADAFDAFNELFDNLPISEKAFELAKNDMVENIRNERIRNLNIIHNYFSNQYLGFDYDRRKDIYTKVPNLTINDIVNFSQTYIKNKPKTYVILGNKNYIDFKTLEKYGDVITLTKEEIFGY